MAKTKPKQPKNLKGLRWKNGKTNAWVQAFKRQVFQFGPAWCSHALAVAHRDAWVDKCRAWVNGGCVGERPKTTRMPPKVEDNPDDPRSHYTVGDMVDQFIVWATRQSEKPKSDKGISKAMLQDWKSDGCYLIERFFGRSRKLTDIGTTDFDEFRYSPHITCLKDGVTPAAPVTVANRISRVTTVLKWTGDVKQDNRLRTLPFATGREFLPGNPDSKDDKERWSPDMFVQQLQAADVKWKAILLLALNCAFQNVDIYDFPIDKIHVDRKLPVHNHPREKTKTTSGKFRACILWPRTVVALKAYLAIRPEPASPKDAEFLFLNDSGKTYTKKTFGEEFNGRVREGVRSESVRLEGAPVFQQLRHSFVSVAFTGRERGDFACLYIQGKRIGKSIEPYLKKIDADAVKDPDNTLLHFDVEPIQEAVDKVEAYYFGEGK